MTQVDPTAEPQSAERTSLEHHPVSVAPGDGIGPEIMDATLRVLREAGASIAVETVHLGEQVYKQGLTSGIAPELWDSVRRTGVLLKGPVTTPQGGGVKSVNVTLRKTLGLYANVRPCRSYHPFVSTHHPNMDLVIVRENEEDLYAGIEHRQTRQVTQCLKLITRPGCERILRYAFEYTRRRARRKLSCLVKDNIMKLTDGLFWKVFEEIAVEYPDVETERLIVDIGMARVATRPERFDVVVLPNLYGDILSDIAAEISGSVGLAGSANIGDHASMFEAIHGSAPDIAGQGIANPSGLLLAGAKMLAHIGQTDVATRVHNAWLKTLEDGIHTGDIYDPEVSVTKVGTKGFADAVIERLGEQPRKLWAAEYVSAAPFHLPAPTVSSEVKELVGVDVFLDWSAGAPDDLGHALLALATDKLPLAMITNRGVKVFPDGRPETFCTDHWRCRFQAAEGTSVKHGDLLALLQRIEDGGLDFIKTENLYTFDGKAGFSLGQGQ